jgi:hypothetical protein
VYPKGEPDSADKILHLRKGSVLITCEGALSLKFKVVISAHAMFVRDK